MEEIFYEMLLTQEIIYHSASTNIIFKENPDQNALEFLASGRNFIMDRLTARNLNENLENNLQLEFFPCLPCGPWIFLVAYGKKSLEEIFNKNMAYGLKYIIGIYAETKIFNL